MAKRAEGPFHCGDCMDGPFATLDKLVAHSISKHQGEPSPSDIVHRRKPPTGDLDKTVEQDD